MNINVKRMGEHAILPCNHNGDWTDLYVHAVEIVRADGLVEFYSMESYIPEQLKNKVVASATRLDAKTPVFFNEGETVVIHLGVAMKLPYGYEGHLLPRSSTFTKTGLLQTNGMGIIDNNYCGDDDEWMAKMYATRHSSVELGQRYHQFRITEKCHSLEFNEVATMNCSNRGGFGSTDK